MKALILSGGGSKGAFQAGVIEQLYKRGERFDVIAGVSVGALNGSMLATGQWSQVVPLWRNIEPDMVLKKRGMVRTGWRYLLHKLGIKKPTLGYFDNSPLLKTLKDNLGESYNADFYCGSLDINTGIYFNFHYENGRRTMPSHINQVVSSTAIPIVFDPVRSNDLLLVDGGVKHVSPIGSVLKMYDNITEVTIITCKKYRGYTPGSRPINDILDVARATLDYTLQEIFEKDIREFERINHMVKQSSGLKRKDGSNYEHYTARLFQPEKNLGDSLNFESKQARKNIDIGLNAKPIDL